MVYDTGGLALEHARRLARDFKEVHYFSPYMTAFPVFKDWAVGLGFEDIHKVPYFYDYVREVDLRVFFDIGAGDLCHDLRKHQQLLTYGAGLGERLEFSRWKFRQLQKKIGLPVQRTALIKGVAKLQKYLKKHPKQYVKLDIFRGDCDSFPAESYEQIELRLDDIAKNFGPYAEDYDFVVEEFVDAEIEVGIDGWFNGFEFLRPVLVGIEHQKSCYIGKFMNQAPSYLENTMTRLTPTLKRLDYRGAISTEERVVSPRKSYFIDICCRFPFPLSAVYTESIENYSEVIWKIANREQVKIKPVAQYVGAVPLESSRAEHHWVYLDFKESKNVKLRVASKLNNKHYGIKGTSVVYVLIAWGDSVKEVIKELERAVKQVNADGLNTDIIGMLPTVKEQTDKLGWT